MADTLYPQARWKAEENGELDKWERSRQANIRCTHAIEKLIASHTRDGQLEPGCAAEALERWGFLRVQYVLANTLLATGGLGFEPESTRWVRSVLIAPDNDNGTFRVQADRSLLAQFVQQTHAEFTALGLFSDKNCTNQKDYEGKVLVLRPNALKGKCWSVQKQLWYGEGGSGCSPNARGQTVVATCLGDGRKARWKRSDFIGVMSEFDLPDWAQEKLAELRGPDQEQANGPAQGGMEMR